MRRQLEGTLAHIRIHAAVLHEMLFRRVPTLDRLGEMTRLPAETVVAALTVLRDQQAVVDDAAGSIVAAYPLSAVPTPHIIDLGIAAPWANCAIDAQASPAMADRRGTIRSF